MATIVWTGRASDNRWSNPRNWADADVPEAVNKIVLLSKENSDPEEDADVKPTDEQRK